MLGPDSLHLSVNPIFSYHPVVCVSFDNRLPKIRLDFSDIGSIHCILYRIFIIFKVCGNHLAVILRIVHVFILKELVATNLKIRLKVNRQQETTMDDQKWYGRKDLSKISVSIGRGYIEAEFGLWVSRRSGSVGIIGDNENWDKRMTLVPAEASADCRDLTRAKHRQKQFSGGRVKLRSMWLFFCLGWSDRRGIACLVCCIFIG